MELLGLVTPGRQRVRRDAEQLDPTRLEGLARLQVNYLLDTSASTRTHGEVQEDGLVVTELGQGDGRTGSGRKGEVGSRLTDLGGLSRGARCVRPSRRRA